MLGGILTSGFFTGETKGTLGSFRGGDGEDEVGKVGFFKLSVGMGFTSSLRAGGGLGGFLMLCGGSS